MRVKKYLLEIIEVEKGGRYLQMGFLEGKDDHSKYNTNLPYKKTLDDWEFYGKAILRILKELKKG